MTTGVFNHETIYKAMAGGVMYYYQFNIGDFDKITRHLSITERGLFRDLLDLYIKDEKPIINNLQKVQRLLCVKSKSEVQALQNVLDDFFVLTDDGYYSEFCQEILNSTVGRAEASRENGKKGGRPSKQSQSQPLASDKPSQSEQKADTKPNESQGEPSENLNKTQEKPNQNLAESYPYTHIPNNPYTHIPKTQTPPNPQSGVCETAAEFLAEAERVKQANAQDIQDWQAPNLDEIRSMLFQAGFGGTLSDSQYNQITADFKTYYAEQAIIGKPIVTDGLRKNKLRDWIMRNAQKTKPSHQNGYQKKSQLGGGNDPLAVNAKFRPNDTGMVAPNTVFEADEHGNFVARPIEQPVQEAW